MRTEAFWRLAGMPSFPRGASWAAGIAVPGGTVISIVPESTERVSICAACYDERGNQEPVLWLSLDPAAEDIETSGLSVDLAGGTGINPAEPDLVLLACQVAEVLRGTYRDALNASQARAA